MAYNQVPKNASTDDSIILLRRILRALEPSTAQDAAQRQRITIDAITTGLTLSTITTVGTVSAVTGITNALPAGTNSIGNFGGYTNVDFQMMNQRIMYNTGLRSKIS
jgi:hypothetical protein